METRSDSPRKSHVKLDLLIRSNNRDGIVGVAMLWVMAGCGVVAIAALSMARAERRFGKLLVDETKNIYAAEETALAASAAGFRTTGETFRLDITLGAAQGGRRVVIDWKKRGGKWWAETWREMP